MKRIALLIPISLMLTGCVTGRGWQGLIPDKDVEMVNPIITIMTPYGQQTLRADRIATRHNPNGIATLGQDLPPLVPKPVVAVP